MTLQVINSTTAGATQDLSSRVFMASERLGLPPFSITQNAEEGSVAHSTLVVDDPSGNLTLKGHRRVYFVETAAPVGSQVIGNTYVGTKEISRGDWRVGPLARTFSVSLQDQNTLISRRLVVGADGNRPAETDVERVQWLMTTTEANEFNGSSTYIDTTGQVNMDAVDYRGQSVTAILSDCSQASGKNWWVIYEESLGEFSLWYDFDSSQAYSSAIRLSNDPDDIDDLVTFAYFPTAIVSQDPSRVYSGTLIDFQPEESETTSWIYETKIATGNEFVFRDVSYPSVNVRTETKARARAVRYNNDSDEEDEVVKLSFVVPSAQVNDLMHGMRIPVKGTHWGGLNATYTTEVDTRCLTRTVTQLSSTHYRIDAELSPIPPLPSEQYFTYTAPAALGDMTWPVGVPGAGNLFVGFIAARGQAGVYTDFIPWSVPSLASGEPDIIAGTNWTHVTGAYVDTSASYPIAMVYRYPTTTDDTLFPLVVGIGGGTGRPRGHFIETDGHSGAPTVSGSQGEMSTAGSTFTSPNITVPAAGRIFAGMSYRAPGPADGSSAAFVMDAVSPAVDLTRGYASGSFAPYSWFGYLDVAAGGTYNISLIRSAVPRNPTRTFGWSWGFWPS